VRVGIVVSKKVGKAVRRNRVRRRLREALRALLREPGWKETAIDLLIVAKPEAVEADYQRLLKDLRGALRKGKLLA
jgi:ribonuclease P protein component